jgi:MFS family permease
MFQAFTVLRERSLLLFFSARSISLLGNAMAPVALSFAVLDMRGASATTLGLVLAARVAAQVLFYLVGGAIADRFARHRVMVLTDLLAALAQGGVALVVISGSVQPLILAALVAVGGAATAMFEPASRSLMPQLVSGQALQPANGLLQLSMRGGSILGAALAGVLVGTIGPGPTLSIDAASFLVSAALISCIRVRTAVSGTDGVTLLRQLLDGWQELVARKWVWVMISQLSFVNVLLAGSFFVLGPVVAKQSLGGAPA